MYCLRLYSQCVLQPAERAGHKSKELVTSVAVWYNILHRCALFTIPTFSKEVVTEAKVACSVQLHTG